MMETFEQLPNKQFAFACLNLLEEAGRLTEDTLSMLTDPETCRRLFCFASGLSVLKEIEPSLTEDEIASQCCISHHRRYYQQLFVLENRFFVVSNHWYGPGRSQADNRTPFLLWVASQLNEAPSSMIQGGVTMAHYKSYTNKSGRTVHYDAAGNRVGVSYQSKSGGKVTHYDAAGNKTGYSYVNTSGRMTHYNAQGDKTGTSYTAYPGRVRHYDNNWHKTGDTSKQFIGHSTEITENESRQSAGSTGGVPSGGAGCATLLLGVVGLLVTGLFL